MEINDLMEHFQKSVFELTNDITVNSYDIPVNPFVIVQLGHSNRENFEVIANYLYQIWPNFTTLPLFWSVDIKDNEISYIKYTFQNFRLYKEESDWTSFVNAISNLRGFNSPFKDKRIFLFYYIIDTSSYECSDEFNKWVKSSEKLIDELDPTFMINELHFVLFDEETKTQINKSKKIKNMICEVQRSDKMKNFLLLSDETNRGILKSGDKINWSLPYHVIVSSIVLSNFHDTHITKTFKENRILTAKYSRKEKPIKEISQIVVICLMDKFNEYITQSVKEVSKFKERIGITKEGTIKFLDDYVDNTLKEALPSKAELDQFPIYDSDINSILDKYGFETPDYFKCTAKEFNKLTCGIWDLYLKELSLSCIGSLQNDEKQRRKWEEMFKNELIENFNTNEILSLSNDLNLEQFFGQIEKPQEEKKVLDVAVTKLKYNLSTDKELINLFLSVINTIGTETQNFKNQWIKFYNSKTKLFNTKEEKVEEFYKNKIKQYFVKLKKDHNFEDEMKKIYSMEDLEKLFKEIIIDILNDDDIYIASFEKELASRLGNVSFVGLGNVIFNELTKEDLCDFLGTYTPLTNQLFSAILMKKGTELYHNLEKTIKKENIKVFDTGNNQAAETLILYEVTTDQIESNI